MTRSNDKGGTVMMNDKSAPSSNGDNRGKHLVQARHGRAASQCTSSRLYSGAALRRSSLAGSGPGFHRNS